MLKPKAKVKPPKEGIFQLTANNVVNEPVIGRDEYGDEIVERIPSVRSEMMMDKGGTLCWIGLGCHRVTTDFSYEKYGAANRLRSIRDGFFPVAECPHTTKYAEYMDGPLATRPEKKVKGKVITEAPCKGATAYHGDPYSDEAKSLHVIRALNETSHYEELNIIPCEHFLTLREKLLGRNAEHMAVQAALMKSGPDANAIQLAAEIAKLAMGSGDVVSARSRMTGDRDDG